MFSNFKTVETADEFQEIRELIDRYTTLKTNKDVFISIECFILFSITYFYLVFDGNSKST